MSLRSTLFLMAGRQSRSVDNIRAGACCGPANKRSILITGGARRIGASMASQLHQLGYDMIIHYNKSHNDASRLVRLLNKRRPHSAGMLQADLSGKVDGCKDEASLDFVQLEETCRTLINNAAKLLSNSELFCVINNASAFLPSPLLMSCEASAWRDMKNYNMESHLAAFIAQTQSEGLSSHTLPKSPAKNYYPPTSNQCSVPLLLSVLSTNMLTPWCLTRSFARFLQVNPPSSCPPAASPCIINVSDALVTHRPHSYYSLYNASKAALEALTVSSALELGSIRSLRDRRQRFSIRVNCIRLGYASFPDEMDATHGKGAKERLRRQIPLYPHREVSYEQISTAVSYLLESANSTGTFIDIDGGLRWR